jgi:hypothetical protein
MATIPLPASSAAHDVALHRGIPMTDTTQTVTDQLLLAVNYDQSLGVMIAAGHYDWSNPDITATRFPITGIGAVSIEAKLFHFDRYIMSDEAVDAIKTADTSHPWEPAKIEHLLSFGASHPEEQRHYPIVALGSVAEVYGSRHVPYLRRDGAERRLRLGWWGGGWRGSCRFLAVRNRSSGA